MQAGGEIKGLGVNALIPRFAGLDDGDWGLARIEPLPVPASDLNYGLRVILRADVLPAWARHEYFFVELPQDSGS